MEITVDDLTREVPDGASLSQVLVLLGEPDTHFIVEINGSYIPKAKYESIKLSSGDRLEVIYPAFGG
ncbi:MAG: sulfur carrier protein ThiS [Deltaproteobacteria bacterium]|nr:sulfur carrier protein ThiS [Deltaproteobacteria bacterium]